VVGNDVVDLRDPDATAERAPRFDARVFCADELRALEASPDRARLRWRLWGAKEAAYKVAVKRNPTTVFSPSRFRVQLAPVACLEAVCRGHVETPVGPLPVEITERDGAIHCVVREHRGRVIAGMTRLAGGDVDSADPEAPGRAARRLAIDEIALSLGTPRSSLEIRKRGRVPELWSGGRPVADLSLSHHGDVVGFACAPDELSGRPS
jgi:hypothetical protein